jgi:hypothetical protein
MNWVRKPGLSTDLESGGLGMSFVFEPTVRKLSLLRELSETQASKQAGERTRGADKPSAAAFPGEVTQVAVINVDTTGREVLLSGQEGFCVQWR